MTHFQSCQLQTKTYGWNDEKLKQDSGKACGLQFQTHTITISSGVTDLGQRGEPSLVSYVKTGPPNSLYFGIY